MPHKNARSFSPSEFQSRILGWYHDNHRVLPWRETGNNAVTPYAVWLSEIMLQQTTVPAVIPYFLKFTAAWPDVRALAAAKDEDVMAAWAGLGYYARARNLLKCARTIVEDWGGEFPQTQEDLLSLPGIGPYTAAAVAAIAFAEGTTVVDGNIERIVARVFAIDTPLPQGKGDIRRAADRIFEGMSRRPARDIRSYPQALMDIGAGVCTPTSPACDQCPVAGMCLAKARGNPAEYPVRAPKKAVTTRTGHVFWIEDQQGYVVFQTRDHDRMLGGMTGLPTTDWDRPDAHPSQKPLETLLDECSVLSRTHVGTVRHVFSHFKLVLDVWDVRVEDIKQDVRRDLASVGGIVYNRHDPAFWDIGVPTVFKKVVLLMKKDVS